MIDAHTDPSDPRALLLVEVHGPITALEVRPVTGGGAVVSFALPDGTRQTYDLFVAARGAPEWLQTALDSAGAVLSIRIEDGGTSTPERTAPNHADLFSPPTPLSLVEVPDLERA